MDTRLLILVVFISMLAGACASDQASGNIEPEATESAPQVIPPGIPLQEKDTGEYLYEGIFDGYLLGQWTFDISVDVLEEEANTSKKGNIIEFKNNYTYEVTQKGKVIESGKFEYNRTREFLVLKPLNADPSEWKVSMLGNSLLWASTERFKNRGTQIRLFQGAVELEDQ